MDKDRYQEDLQALRTRYAARSAELARMGTSISEVIRRRMEADLQATLDEISALENPDHRSTDHALTYWQGQYETALRALRDRQPGVPLPRVGDLCYMEKRIDELGGWTGLARHRDLVAQYYELGDQLEAHFQADRDEEADAERREKSEEFHRERRRREALYLTFCTIAALLIVTGAATTAYYGIYGMTACFAVSFGVLAAYMSGGLR